MQIGADRSAGAFDQASSSMLKTPYPGSNHVWPPGGMPPGDCPDPEFAAHATVGCDCGLARCKGAGGREGGREVYLLSRLLKWTVRVARAQTALYLAAGRGFKSKSG